MAHDHNGMEELFAAPPGRQDDSSEDPMPGIGEDVRGVADDEEDDEFEDMDDADEEDEEGGESF